MTKEQLFAKWTINPDFKYDLESVIATEIAKVQDAQPQPENLKGNCSTFDMSRLVDQPQPAKPFDRDRFERMFRAVVASGRTESYEQDFLATNICLEKLDAYYAEKKGGNNE